MAGVRGRFARYSLHHVAVAAQHIDVVVEYCGRLQPRSANATAVENCELMVIERRNFLPFILSYPEMAIMLLELVSARLRQSNEQIEDVMFTGLQVRLARAILKLLKTTGYPF